jgi:hypothetical protein
MTEESKAIECQDAIINVCENFKVGDVIDATLCMLLDIAISGDHVPSFNESLVNEIRGVAVFIEKGLYKEGLK